MFDKKQKSCVKRIHLVTDDGLYDRKAFYKVKIVFIHPLQDLKISWYNQHILEISLRSVTLNNLFGTAYIIRMLKTLYKT